MQAAHADDAGDDVQAAGAKRRRSKRQPAEALEDSAVTPRRIEGGGRGDEGGTVAIERLGPAVAAALVAHGVVVVSGFGPTRVPAAPLAAAMVNGDVTATVGVRGSARADEDVARNPRRMLDISAFERDPRFERLVCGGLDTCMSTMRRFFEGMLRGNAQYSECVLVSGPRTDMQTWHKDFPYARTDVRQQQYSIILAVEQCWLAVVLGSHQHRGAAPLSPAAAVRLQLEPGDMVLFRGDTVHAGAPSSADNATSLRLHYHAGPHDDIRERIRGQIFVEEDMPTPRRMPTLRAAEQEARGLSVRLPTHLWSPPVPATGQRRGARGSRAAAGVRIGGVCDLRLVAAVPHSKAGFVCERCGVKVCLACARLCAEAACLGDEIGVCE